MNKLTRRTKRRRVEPRKAPPMLKITSLGVHLGLHKMFTALPEEEKGTLRTIYFALLLLIDPIAMMSMLVVEIFDRHLGDMKWRQFPKKKNTYGLKKIDDALKQTKLERHQDDVHRLNLLKIMLSFILPNKGRNVLVKYVDLVDDLQRSNRFPWAMKLSETDMQQDLMQEAMRYQIEVPTIGAVPRIGTPAVGAPAAVVPVIGLIPKIPKMGLANRVPRKGWVQLPKLPNIQLTAENLFQQVTPREILEVTNTLMVDDDVEVGGSKFQCDIV
ncbi:hypothetical protein GIB67_035845 [Kingdonia uniflora]|uniref:Uncharacterized protein n=1 Tax=Kingdonia uniflora TaxID=39325 RepID=A0A7J7MK43_9MAGN|nr:hypothetical protein GIB67_035845 [Kingdonia uniflora]